MLQPEVLLADDVREKRLVRILPAWKVPSRPLNLVYVRDRQMTPKLQRFIDFAAERFTQPREGIPKPQARDNDARHTDSRLEPARECTLIRETASRADCRDAVIALQVTHCCVDAKFVQNLVRRQKEHAPKVAFELRDR